MALGSVRGLSGRSPSTNARGDTTPSCGPAGLHAAKTRLSKSEASTSVAPDPHLAACPAPVASIAHRRASIPWLRRPWGLEPHLVFSGRWTVCYQCARADEQLNSVAPPTCAKRVASCASCSVISTKHITKSIRPKHERLLRRGGRWLIHGPERIFHRQAPLAKSRITETLVIFTGSSLSGIWGIRLVCFNCLSEIDAGHVKGDALGISPDLHFKPLLRSLSPEIRQALVQAWDP
ncbi:hypothetical protein FH972_021980 [Carpinus fangiana]|uniref:Uncharacterized protein n=1 Tax=Carpinus fangiana TaxID=176857 RepID=A0A5N6KRJ4_9ROSI|nr:hypothetical protein FH972_021980 [Carpinus fangiana]